MGEQAKEQSLSPNVQKLLDTVKAAEERGEEEQKKSKVVAHPATAPPGMASAMSGIGTPSPEEI